MDAVIISYFIDEDTETQRTGKATELVSDRAGILTLAIWFWKPHSYLLTVLFELLNLKEQALQCMRGGPNSSVVEGQRV